MFLRSTVNNFGLKIHSGGQASFLLGDWHLENIVVSGINISLPVIRVSGQGRLTLGRVFIKLWRPGVIPTRIGISKI
jgi:hypothetical protein